MATRPAIFNWRQTEPVLILCAVRWYLRYSLSLRDIEELLDERGLQADHTTVWRWVQRYGPELEQRLRRLGFSMPYKRVLPDREGLRPVALRWPRR
jgi:valyl-tRNA synthetase